MVSYCHGGFVELVNRIQYARYIPFDHLPDGALKITEYPLVMAACHDTSWNFRVNTNIHKVMTQAENRTIKLIIMLYIINQTYISWTSNILNLKVTYNIVFLVSSSHWPKAWRQDKIYRLLVLGDSMSQSHILVDVFSDVPKSKCNATYLCPHFKRGIGKTEEQKKPKRIDLPGLIIPTEWKT